MSNLLDCIIVSVFVLISIYYIREEGHKAVCLSLCRGNENAAKAMHKKYHEDGYV